MGRTVKPKEDAALNRLVSSPLSIGWKNRTEELEAVSIDGDLAVGTYGFTGVAPGTLELPIGWWVDLTAPASLNDGAGTSRALIEPATKSGPARIVFPLRFTIRELNAIERIVHASKGHSRIAVCDRDDPVFLAREFADWDDEARNACIEALTCWLSKIRPEHADLDSYWDQAPIDGEGTALQGLGGVDRPTWLAYVGDETFEALCKGCGCERVVINGKTLPGWMFPHGWAVDGRHGIRDAKLRLRVAFKRHDERSVTLSFLPRYRVATISPGDSAGDGIRLCKGRVRVAILDADQPVLTSAEFADDAVEAIGRAAKALVSRLATTYPDHADPLAYWSDDVAGFTGD